MGKYLRYELHSYQQVMQADFIMKEGKILEALLETNLCNEASKKGESGPAGET